MTENTHDRVPRTRRGAPAPRNVQASIRERLKNQARSHGEDMLYVLSRYAIERLLYRFGRSSYADQFVVKGALLFSLWRDHPHRPTRDLDLLGFGSEDSDRIRLIFADLCALSAGDVDGLIFRPETIQVTPIRETQEYGGLRVALWALLGRTRIHVQVDIGFGDVITPGATFADFPSLIGLPPPHVRVYPPETVVAEKYEALVRLGMVNSRMKDFYDLWALAHERAFTGRVLAEAIQATFTRRGAVLPAVIPLALTNTFTTAPATLQLWQAFTSRNKLEPTALNLAEIINALQMFLLPPTQALLATARFEYHWAPGGPWQPSLFPKDDA
jgi:nucleotidyltransferase AbiEii toxin of type IV toxin-antitoxin system